ncbi:hypothetical protein CBD41_01040 [bacterium TMED181]|nr:hypothetical protein [Planctomycetota bacterium]OUW47424.1 MAG: hypothetical protein CBD41_01040 [bacterium TMED181]
MSAACQTRNPANREEKFRIRTGEPVPTTRKTKSILEEGREHERGAQEITLNNKEKRLDLSQTSPWGDLSRTVITGMPSLANTLYRRYISFSVQQKKARKGGKVLSDLAISPVLSGV